VRPALALAAAALCAGCFGVPADKPPALTSFEVTVKGVFQRDGATRTPLRVAATCAQRYGGDAQVPADVRGTHDCRYVIPRGEVEVDIHVRALLKDGVPLSSFEGPVSFRVVPGDIVGDYQNRWGMAVKGELEATVLAVHQFGVARVWAEDAPPQIFFDGGVVGGTVAQLPPEPPVRTYATGLSQPIYFEDHTVQSLQLPDGFDNRTSPFVGEFVTVGKTPESGEQLLQNCTDDPERNTRQAAMVVTGLDPGGFFVTDLTACRLKEWTKDSSGSNQVRTPEPPEPCLAQGADGGLWNIEDTDAGTGKCAVEQKACTARGDCAGYLPGTFGSMYIYNYSFPDGLSEGDLLFTLSGAVQEFTSTTQLTFPAWSIAERVHTLPPDQWNKWLQYAPVTEVVGRMCGLDDAFTPFVTDVACGHNKRNLKMESLESSLVRLRNVRVPEVYANCDFNADGTVPFFCEQTGEQGQWLWGSCAFGEVEPENDRLERECNQNCVLGAGPFAGKRCGEEATFIGFGQFPVVMNSPGPAFAGLDDSLPQRTEVFPVPMGASVQMPTPVPSGEEIVNACDGPVHYRFGDQTVAATATDPVLPKNTPLNHFLETGFDRTAFLATEAGTTCYVSWNPRMHVNLVLKDAIPDIRPDCHTDDKDPERARQCKLFIEATYDVVGHLRHVQPARPRWVVLPRSAEDVCCHPGPEGECPKPLKQCPVAN